MHAEENKTSRKRHAESMDEPNLTDASDGSDMKFPWTASHDAKIIRQTLDQTLQPFLREDPDRALDRLERWILKQHLPRRPASHVGKSLISIEGSISTAEE